ncbi:carbohydrate binding domain-containing protein [Paenibacillus sp. NPDC058071]|uniref:hemoblobin-interacting domain-containing protein n=1 Tax=Paenibacillus sp. NPDC058071 TaxID=3346326 RepID=UPI0036DC774F
MSNRNSRGRSRGSLKSMLIVALCLTVIFSSFPGAYAAQAAPVSAGSDLTGHWAAAEVGKWMDKGLADQYPDGTFKPNKPITRAEFTKLVNTLFGFHKADGTSFSDVEAGKWYAEHAAIGRSAGYISGYPDGTFKPNQPITRQEAAKMTASLFRVPAASAGEPLQAYADRGQVGAFAADSLGRLAAGGYLKGFTDGTIRPLAPITRGEAITLLDRLAGEIYNKAGVYADKAELGRAIVNTTDVTLENARINGNLLLAPGIKEGDFTLKKGDVKGTVYVSGGGVNSVYITDSTVNDVVIDKPDGEVRVVFSGTTSAGSVTLLTAGHIEAGPGVSVQRLESTVPGSTLNGEALKPGEAVLFLNGKRTPLQNGGTGSGAAGGSGGGTGGGNGGNPGGGNGENPGGGNGENPGGGNGENPGGNNEWKLVWSDEFDGSGTNLDTNGVNLDKWGYQTGTGSQYGLDGWGNQEEQYYRPENIKVEDGKLVITAKTDGYGGKPYTSGRLYTEPTFTKTYGKFEAKMSLPKGNGLWPAFWMMPASSEYGVWASSGEIDIMEARGRLPQEVGGAIHYGRSWPGNKSTSESYHFDNDTDITEEHVYGVEWEPGELRWYVDGQLFQKINNWDSTGADKAAKYAYPAPFDKPFYMILNLAVGGVFDNVQVDQSKLPAQMTVDYVRVYEPKGRPYRTPTEPVLETEPLPEPHKAAIDGNYVHDANFEQPITKVAAAGDSLNTENWNLVHMPDFQGNGTAAVDVVSGKRYAKTEITAGGNAVHSVQMIQNVTVGKGRWYKLSFDAKSTSNRDITVKIGGGENRGWSTYSDSITYGLTPEFKTYEMTFPMEKDSDALARLEFNLGLNVNPVWIGSVKLEEIEPLDPFNELKPKEPIAGNYIYNGTFDLGRMDRLTYWNFEAKQGASATANVDAIERQFQARITSGGAAAAAVTLSQTGIKLQPDNEYKLTFKGRADSGRTIRVALAKPDGEITGEIAEITLSATMEDYEAAFTTGADAEANGKVIFLLGGHDADVWLDNIVLNNVSEAEVELPLAEQFLIRNGDFSNGKTYWNKHVQGDYGGSTSKADISVSNGEMKVAIDDEGSGDYHVMLMQNDFQLRAGRTYVVTAKLKSSKPRETEIAIDDTSYTKYLSQRVQLTDQYQTLQYEIKLNDDKRVSFKLLLGQLSGAAKLGAHDVFVDDVHVELKGAREKAFPLRNGYFTEGAANWQTHLQGQYDGDSSAAFSFDGGAFKGAIANAGANTWDIQLSQGPFELKAGKTYIVSFDARSTLPRAIDVIAENTTFYHRYLNQLTRLQSTTNSYSFEFTMPADDAATLKFLLGQPQEASDKLSAAHDVFIDNVRFELKGAREATGELLPTTNDIRLLSPPSLEADSIDNVIGKNITLAFQDNEPWRNAVTEVVVNGTPVSSSDYSVEPGKIELAASLFAAEGLYTFVVKATGYELATARHKIEEQVWTLFWNDEFDRSGSNLDTNGLDLDKWGYQLGTGSQYGLTDWGNQEQQYYREQNVEVTGGKLVFTAKNDGFNGKPYTSGRVFTGPTFTKEYGKFEARMKLPEGQGLWPAFWMMPADSEYGGWASSGEIDIMEARGRLPGEVGGTIHYGKTAPNNRATGAEYHFPNGEKISDYHTYSVEWEPGELRWYVDGELYQQVDNWHSWGVDQPDKYAFPAPFDKPFYIIMNLAVGGMYDGHRLPDASDLPAKMEVDYVRVYELTGRPYKSPVEPSMEQEELPADAKPAINGNYIYDPGYANGIKDIAASATPLDPLYWNFLHTPDFGGSGSVSVEQVDGTPFANVQIGNGGNAGHSLQLIQYATLVKGRSYKLSFDAKAAGNRSISVKLGGDADNGWGAYTDNYDVPLAANMKHFEYRFQMTSETDSAARLEFNLGLNTNAVWIGNVVLEEIDTAVDSDGAKEPMGNGEHVYNGRFDLGSMDRMRYWSFNSENGATASASVNPAIRKLEAAILNGGTAPNDVTLTQKGINLLQGDSYTLTFSASADSNRSIDVSLRSKDGSVTYASKSDFTIGANPAEQTFSFTMPANVTDTEGQLVFELGGSNVGVTLDDISLIRTTDLNVDFSGVDLFPLKNGDFTDGLTAWEPFTQNGVAAFTTDGGAARIDVQNTGGEGWNVMLNQSGLILKKGFTYEFEFRAKSSVIRDIEASLENAGYTRRFETGSIELGTDWKTYRFSFKSAVDDNLALKFLLGKTSQSPSGPHQVWIDDVVLRIRNAPVLQPPTIVPVRQGNLEGSVITLLHSPNGAWQGAITSIEVNGTALQAGDYVLGADSVTLHPSAFTGEGSYTIRFKATGYADAIVEQKLLAADGNLLANGKFNNGAAGWEYWTGDDGFSDFTVENEQAKLDIFTHGGFDPQWNVPYSWSTQLSQNNIRIEAGKMYELSFRAWSTVDRPVLLELSKPENVMWRFVIPITNDDTAVYSRTLRPSVNQTFDLKFLLGNIVENGLTVPAGSHQIRFDDILLKEVVAGPVIQADTTDAKIGQPIELTFADNAAWRGAITGVYIDGVSVDPGKAIITAGKITLDASLFPSVKTYAIVIKATGYGNAELSQPISTNQPNVALGKTATASTGTASLAIDGRGTGQTRWESAHTANEWITIDLGRLYAIDTVVLNWEAAYGKVYKIQISTADVPSESDWTDAYSETAGNGGIDTIQLGGAEARHIRMLGIERGLPYGYSLWEFEVYGAPAGPVLKTPPALTADTTDNKPGKDIELTYTGDADWLAAITGIKLNGANVSAGLYELTAGKIVLKATLFQEAGSYNVAVAADGYEDAIVQQTILAEVNLALGKAAEASSSTGQANAATDGLAGTRWEADWNANRSANEQDPVLVTPEWISVDLGSVHSLSKLKLHWETAYGKKFEVQVAQPAAAGAPLDWVTVLSLDRVLNDPVKIDLLDLPSGTEGRYIRIYMTERGMPPYGPSLYEIEVYS